MHQSNIQQQMMRTRKLPMLKSYSQRLRTRLFFDLLQQQQQEQTQQQPNHISQPVQADPEQDPQEEEEEPIQLEEQGDDEIMEANEGEQDFSVADYIQMLSSKDREIFKKENPQLPPLFFMTRAEKKKYFEQLNKSFRQGLSKTPQRKSKTKKILKFRDDFQVKHFSEHQKVVALSRAKQMKQPYHQKIHFS